MVKILVMLKNLLESIFSTPRGTDRVCCRCRSTNLAPLTQVIPGLWTNPCIDCGNWPSRDRYGEDP